MADLLRKDIEDELAKVNRAGSQSKAAKKNRNKTRSDNVRALLVARGVPANRHDLVISDLPSYLGWEDDGVVASFREV